ncbi:MAG: type II toxin-antitoxin system VapC family toxin [Candidatus Binatia bacterium]
MTFGEIEEGSAVFVDANVFVYHFTGVSAECTALLARCETTELRGSTSAVVLAEACHRLMMIEAVERKLVPAGNVARRLARRPAVVRQLATYEANVEAICQMGIEVAPLTAATVVQGLRLQKRYGLLTNDSLLVATMLREGIRVLASADRRLGVASEIEIAVPADLS